MLERVPASAESAGFLLWRHIERQNLSSLRSGRVLDPQFWRHGARHIESPTTWWSSYLQAVRVVPQSAACPPPAAPVTRSKYTPLKLNDCSVPKRRPYTNTSVSRQEPPSQPDPPFVDPFFPAQRLENRPPDVPSKEQPQSEHIATEEQHRHHPEPLNRAQIAFNDIVKLADVAKEADLDAAWKLFIRLEDQHRHASDILYLLSKSENRRHALRGIQTFESIALSDRSKRDYDSVIRLHLYRARHRAAIRCALDGTAHGFDLLPTLLAEFVNNSRWKAVAELVHSYFEAPPNISRIHQFEQPLDYLLGECFALELLPTLALELAHRLIDRRAVDAQQHNILVELCRTFLRRCVMHPDTIHLLTPDTMAGLFDVQEHFGHMDLHSHAITTFCSLPNRAARASLALLALRDWVKRFPDQTISRPMLGSLILMCDEASLSPFAYQYLIDQWRRCHGKPDIKAYQRILTGCARLGNAEAVEEYLSMFQRDHGAPESLALLSPLIYVRAVVGDAKGASEAFHRIRSDFGLIPHRVCWNMLMYAHYRSGDMVTCFDVFDDMVEAGIQPGSDSYGILLAVSAAIGDVDAVIGLLQEAQQKKLEVTVPMMGCLVDAYLKDENITAARQTVTELSQSEPPETLTRLWNSLLRHHAQKGDWVSVLNTQTSMHHSGIEPDEMTYATLLTTLAMVRGTQEASKLLRSIRSRTAAHITDFHHAIILHGYVREGNAKGARSTYQEMEKLFPDLNASVRKSILTLKVTEDQKSSASLLNPNSTFLVRYSDTLEYLASLVANVSSRDLASKVAGPGLRRNSTSHGLAQQYLETILTSLIANGSYADAQHFLSSYEKIVEEHSRTALSVSRLAIRLDTLQMRLVLQRGDIDEVKNRWTHLFQRAVGDLAPLNTKVRKRKPEHEADRAVLEDDLSTEAKSEPPTSEPNLVIRSRRYALSEPLSIFIEAMAKEEAYEALFDFIESDFLRAGFRLSNHNINRLVQLLCLAKSTDLRIRAFKIAERMFPTDFDFEPWKLLMRGKMVLPKRAPEHTRTQIIKRAQISSYNPSIRVATYLTWNYLSYALAQAHHKGEAGDRMEMQTLLAETPRTVEFIQHPGGLKQYARRVLLTDSAMRGDRPRQLQQGLEVRDSMDGMLRQSIDGYSNEISSPDWEAARLDPALQEDRTEAKKLRTKEMALRRAERWAEHHEGRKWVPSLVYFRRRQEELLLFRPLNEGVLSEEEEDIDITAFDKPATDTTEESEPTVEEMIEWTPSR